MERFLVAALLLASLICTAVTDFTPYQVAIRLRNEIFGAQGADYHLCSGIIVYENYILTTAQCLRTQNSSLPITNSMVYVAGGFLRNGTLFSQINREVANFTIHQKYNPITNEHNVALIKLKDPLPLYKSEVKAIQLDNGKTKKDNCYITFMSQNSSVVDDYFDTIADINFYDMYHCNRSMNFTGRIDDDDLCSYFFLKPNYWCTASADALKYHPDRGSALICNNVLIGILNKIVPPDSPYIECNKSKPTLAFYTSIEEHLEWIHKTLGITEIKPTKPSKASAMDISFTIVTLLTIVSVLLSLL